MILCSCNILTRKRIEAAAEELVRLTPDRPVTAGRVFRECNVRPQCGGCLELIRREVRQMGLPVTCPEPLGSASDSSEMPPLDERAPQREPV